MRNKISIKEKLNELFNLGNYEKALKFAQDQNFSKINDVELLKLLARIYEKNERFIESKEFLLRALDSCEERTSILKSLIKVSIECKDIELASKTLDEFRSSNIKDVEVDYLEYRIMDAKGFGSDQKIELLEKLQKTYYKPEWMYQLALEYEKIGDIESCISQCEELDLWFSDGEYVINAIQLKSKYKPLTPLEKNKLISFNSDNQVIDYLDYSNDQENNSYIKTDYNSDGSEIIYKFLDNFEKENSLSEVIFNKMDIDEENPTINLSNVVNIESKEIFANSIENSNYKHDELEINTENNNISNFYDINFNNINNGIEDDSELSVKELAEILAGDEEYEEEIRQKSKKVEDVDRIKDKIERLRLVIANLENEELFVGNKKYIILRGHSKRLVEEFITIFTKICKSKNSRNVSTISAVNLNKAYIKDIYSKISNRYLIVKNAEELSKDTCTEIVEAANYNNNIIIIFTTDLKHEVEAIKSHLLEKMIAINIDMLNDFNDNLTYAILYSALHGYNITEYGLKAIEINEDEIFSRSDSYIAIEKILDEAMFKFNEDVSLFFTNIQTNEKNLTDNEIVYAIQKLMDKNII